MPLYRQPGRWRAANTTMRRPLSWRLGCVAVGLCLTWNAVAAITQEPEPDWSKERSFWAFQPPVNHARPAVQNARWPRRTVDYFVLARIEAEGATPARQAGKRTLIRRLTQDLTGLPPTLAEVDAFLGDSTAEAYTGVVERLLASPRFGERMASLWLPLARYAEDQAHQVGKDTKFFYPNAWRYRAWVIEAFNRDLPYDQFLALQVAADRLEGETSTNLAALGFLGLGPKYYNRDRLDVQADEWEDRVDTVTRAMLGLTVACARCHDHKFDPITMRDYYALAGVFASTRLVNRRPHGGPEKNDIQSTNMSPAGLHVVEDIAEPADLPVFQRGNVDRKGPPAPRRFLRVLSESEPPAFQEGSGRRELALAIVDRQNPLTARVFVNRVWGQLFGKPLVSTPSNFGHSGQTPTHPELLDDLAVRFMENGWSVKWLVCELVHSATYRQDSRGSTSERGPATAALASALDGEAAPGFRPAAEPVDPENRWLARMTRRRLTVEQWRDTLLFLSEELQDGDGKSLELDDPTNRCRTVYARVSRLKLNDLLQQFDYPDANVHAEKRANSTTAIQKLFLLNSPFMMDRAGAFARRIAIEAGTEEARRVGRAYQLAFGREPTREETQLALEFLARPAEGEMSRWQQYAQLLLAANELLYVD